MFIIKRRLNDFLRYKLQGNYEGPDIEDFKKNMQKVDIIPSAPLVSFADKMRCWKEINIFFEIYFNRAMQFQFKILYTKEATINDAKNFLKNTLIEASEDKDVLLNISDSQLLEWIHDYMDPIDKSINNVPFVPVVDKEFISIGKIIFKTNSERDIPQLHYMVNKTVSENFEATLLEFGLVSWSEKENEAIINLVKQTYFHIFTSMEKNCFDNCFSEELDYVMQGYWGCYIKNRYSQASKEKKSDYEKEDMLDRVIKDMFLEEAENDSIAISNKDLLPIFSAITYISIRTAT
jgi:hypothetical protein